MKKFNNRLNELITTTDGRKLYHSRSVAVVPQILAFASILNNVPFVLLTLRGPGCPDEVGKWCLPCGYLDWDETAAEAVRREVWEEGGIDLLDESQVFLASSLESVQPWKVGSDPTKDPRQNVTLHYAIELDGLELAEELPIVSNKNDQNNEVTDVKWIPVDEAIQMDLAFGHQHYIREFYEDLK